MKFKVTPELEQLLRTSGSYERDKAIAATYEIAKAAEAPIRQGILDGDILDGIFEPVVLTNGASPEFPLHFLAPGTERDFVAYTIPNAGYIPQRNIEGDYVMINTYDIGNAIDWNLKYARDARFDIISDATDVFYAGFKKKLNDDGWHVILAAGYDRNIVVADADAAAGQFTKRLVSLGKTVMRRNGGGNSTSVNRGKLTDLYLSPEAMEDIRNWNVDQVDEVTRREIYVSDADEAVSRIFGVNLHTLDELGEAQEYNTYYTGTLVGTIPAGDVEMAVGLDLRNRGAFKMPIREEASLFVDEALHRQKRGGIYGWAEQGFGCLDNRRVILFSL